MGPFYVVLVAVTAVSVVMAAFGVGWDSFDFEEAESYSWGFSISSREILRRIASDSSTSAIFLSVLRNYFFACRTNSRLLRPLPPMGKSRSSHPHRT